VGGSPFFGRKVPLILTQFDPSVHIRLTTHHGQYLDGRRWKTMFSLIGPWGIKEETKIRNYLQILFSLKANFDLFLKHINVLFPISFIPFIHITCLTQTSDSLPTNDLCVANSVCNGHFPPASVAAAPASARALIHSYIPTVVFKRVK
jgi:hypothetical protein